MPTKPESDFTAVYTQLRAIMRKYESSTLRPQVDQPDHYELVGPPTERSQGKAVWFGAVRRGKSYVSYHLMPVYAYPDLLEGLSAELKGRMQGKSCFNFTRVDERLAKELAKLTDRSYKRFKKEKLLG